MPQQPSNRLLAALGPTSYAHLVSLSERVDLPVGTVLYRAHAAASHAYFLESGIASAVVFVGEAACLEVGMIADEGVVSYWALLGRGEAVDRCSMQASGTGYRIPIEPLREAFRSSDEIRRFMLAFAQEQVIFTMYLAACSKLHKAERRLARWLLMVQDRLHLEVLPLTQEVMGEMLGTRRMTVAAVASTLQRNGLIESRRGQVRIVDRAGLEEMACSCYGQLRALDQALYL